MIPGRDGSEVARKKASLSIALIMAGVSLIVAGQSVAQDSPGWPLKSQHSFRERLSNLYSMPPLLRFCQAKGRTLLLTVEKEQY
jgi:transposase